MHNLIGLNIVYIFSAMYFIFNQLKMSSFIAFEPMFLIRNVKYQKMNEIYQNPEFECQFKR